MNTLKSPLSFLLKAPSKSFLWKLPSLDIKVGRTVIVFNENSYKGQKEIKAVVSGHSVCHEFGRNFPNAFLHHEKSMKSGDADNSKRTRKVKVFYKGEVTWVSQSSGM